ncbi:MAG: AAA family ATPase, partial [Candidatus Thalassarchaeaceae archaeon]
MLKITVSGPPGSGTSTLVKGICKRTGWKSVNGGDVFRAHAKNAGLTVEEFSKLCRKDLGVDRGLDESLKSLMREDSGPEVIESRL